MKTERPPILSDEQMFNIREEQAYRTKDNRETLACLICSKTGACLIFPHQPTDENGKPRWDVCSICLNDADRVIAYYEPLIQQAKAEVAREIFEEIEGQLFSPMAMGRGELDFCNTTRHSLKIWQSLKSKYGGQK